MTKRSGFKANMIKAGCTGKRSFDRFSLADKAAKRRNREDGDAHVEAYHCRVCNQFHVGEDRSYGLRDARRTVNAQRE